MKTFHILFTLFIVSAWGMGCSRHSGTVHRPDALLFNGNFVHFGDSQEIAALAISGDTISAVYTIHDSLPDAGQRIDLKGAWVYPGFIDAHAHLFAYAKGLAEVQLVGTRSWQEVLVRLQDYAASHPDGPLVGRGWDQNDWPDSDFPTRDDLDSLFPNRPVYLTRVDGHAVLVNAAVLELNGLSSPQAIAGGEFISYPHAPSVLTGLLVDAAMDAVKIPAWSNPRLAKALLDAEEHLLAAGLTGLTDAGLTGAEIELLDSLYTANAMRIRVNAMIALSDTATVRNALESGPYITPKFQVRSVKCYSDGALGSRGACLTEPYADRPNHFGALIYDSATVHRWAREIHAAGFQLNTHAIGDSANSVILKIYDEVLPADADARWRIEHAQILRVKDREYFDAHRILPSVQPTHATSDHPWAPDRLGEHRMHRAYAYRSLLKQSGRIPLGTDFPVEGIDPIATYRSAVFRRDEQGYPQEGFLISEALSPEQALRGMTEDAAFAQFEEHKKGAFEVGKYADFTILDGDLRSATWQALSQIRVIMNWIAGDCVYISGTPTSSAQPHSGHTAE